jgi:hypothetical protein
VRELHSTIEDLERTPRIRQKRRPEVSQLGASAAAREQRAPQGAFEGANAFADSRLRNIQSACSATERPLAHDPLEREQLARINLHREIRYTR